MTTADVRTDDEAGVTIRCRDNVSVGVTFRDRFSFDADSVHYAVTTWLEAGEQMTSLAADVRALLAGEHQ